MTPDRQKTTMCLRDEIKIRTWNVRTMFQSRKLENIKQEMSRLKVNVLGLCEIRWSGAGKISEEEQILIYSGGKKHERGVGLLLD